jgi:hypothetical protein
MINTEHVKHCKFAITIENESANEMRCVRNVYVSSSVPSKRDLLRETQKRMRSMCIPHVFVAYTYAMIRSASALSWPHPSLVSL